MKRAQKLAKKKLKALKAIENQKNEFTNHLKRELKYTNLTYEKAAKDWENLLSDIKLSSLKNDLEISKADVDHMLNTKDNLINRSGEQYEIAIEQYNHMTQKHFDFIEYLIKLYNVFQKSMKEFYDLQCFEWLNEYTCEEEWRSDYHDRTKTYFENILHSINVITNDNLEKLSESFYYEKEGIIYNSMDKRQKLNESIAKKMNDSYQQMHNILNVLNTLRESPKRKEIYERCLMREQTDFVDIEKMKIIQKQYSHKLSKLQMEMLDYEMIFGQKRIDLQHEHKYFLKYFDNFKEKFRVDMDQDKEQLLELVQQTTETINHLKSIHTKAESIQRIISICYKYQTQMEKNVPWPIDFDFVKTTMTCYETKLGSLDFLTEMEFFWYKVSKINENNLELQEEISELTNENQYLRNRIRQYCETQTSNESIRLLNISPFPTIAKIPMQEASHMRQFKNKL